MIIPVYNAGDFLPLSLFKKCSIKFLDLNIRKVEIWDYVQNYYIFGIKVFQNKNIHT